MRLQTPIAEISAMGNGKSLIAKTLTAQGTQPKCVLDELALKILGDKKTRPFASHLKL